MASAAKRTSGKAKAPEVETLVLPAIEITQGRGRKVFAFPVDGKLLPRFTSVSRIARNDRSQITGYQRPEVLSHISQIKKYLESDDPMLPNAIVVAFDRSVRFTPASEARAADGRVGALRIPLRPENEPGAGLIVDGQQRSAALRDADVRRFPVFVVGFIAENEDEQREQFVLVNSTKPLPKGLLHELLPSFTSLLPPHLARRQFAATLLARLNHDKDSPFKGIIITPTAPGGVVKDNSVLLMLDNSLSDGALFRFKHSDRDSADSEGMLTLLKHYWTAVSTAFPHAWNKPPKNSRLMHGAGIVAMGFIMDAIADRLRSTALPSPKQFGRHLQSLASECRWTEGYWAFGRGMHVKWNELQNTKRHTRLLTDHLIAIYRAGERS
jgi:DGQHR domain-containing protein